MTDYIYIKECIEAQRKYCRDNNYPCFIPNDGKCFSCRKQIFSEYNDGGINIKRASSELITGCPHCNRSYCD